MTFHACTLSATQNTTQAAVSLFPYSHSRIKRRGYTNFVVIYQEEHPLFVRFLKRCHKIIFKHAASQKGYIIRRDESKRAQSFFFTKRENIIICDSSAMRSLTSPAAAAASFSFLFFFHSDQTHTLDALSPADGFMCDTQSEESRFERKRETRRNKSNSSASQMRLLLSTFSWRMLDPGLAKKLHFSTKMRFFLICFLLLQVTFFTLKIRSTHKNL
jgi:hypothetical protein